LGCVGPSLELLGRLTTNRAANGGPVVPAWALAEEAGYQLNSHFRSVLAGMARCGLLLSTSKGYRRLL
jgi:hypothetical protein